MCVCTCVCVRMCACVCVCVRARVRVCVSVTRRQSCSGVLPWKCLCQARTTSGLKAFTTYTEPGRSTSRSAHVHSTRVPRHSPPSREPSSLYRVCSVADRPWDDQQKEGSEEEEEEEEEEAESEEEEEPENTSSRV